VIPIPLANNVSGAVQSAATQVSIPMHPGPLRANRYACNRTNRSATQGSGRQYSATSVAGKATSSGYIQAAADPDGSR